MRGPRQIPALLQRVIAPLQAAAHALAPGLRRLWSPMGRMWQSVHARWLRLAPLARHWAFNVLLGIFIESILIVGHHQHWGWVVGFQNAGLDLITRLSRASCECAYAWRAEPVQPDQPTQAGWFERRLGCPAALNKVEVPMLLDIDTTTWRSRDWGGGEPDLAPRDELATLIERAFEYGARHVVVDIDVQDRVPAATAPKALDAAPPWARPEDQAFAARLEALLEQPYFKAGRMLTLVRAERMPWLDERANSRELTGAFLGELRGSAAIDPVIAKSSGRITVAAPYFVVDPGDRQTRHWDLFKVVCERNPQSPQGGWMRIVPSVQLLVNGHRFGVAPDIVEPVAGEAPLREACMPFPLDGKLDLSSQGAAHLREDLHRKLTGADCKPDKPGRTGCEDFGAPGAPQPSLERAYWDRLRAAFAKQLPPTDRDIEPLPEAGGLGNRIIYRYADKLSMPRAYPELPPHVASHPDEPTLVQRLSALPLLYTRPTQASADTGTDLGLKEMFRDRVVVIGQTYDEAGDRFHTPLGEMAGAVVLVNAIDSMYHYRLLRPPSGLLSLSVALVLIVLVGYLFARWESLLGTVFATTAVVLSAGVASFFMLQQGIWLDFAAPIVGIQIHRAWAAFEEHRELRRHRKLHGAH